MESRAWAPKKNKRLMKDIKARYVFSKDKEKRNTHSATLLKLDSKCKV